ncbi:hypothetical protein YB2330_001132 [Saitoella coloradoensis]
MSAQITGLGITAPVLERSLSTNDVNISRPSTMERRVAARRTASTDFGFGFAVRNLDVHPHGMTPRIILEGEKEEVEQQQSPTPVGSPRLGATLGAGDMSLGEDMFEFEEVLKKSSPPKPAPLQIHVPYNEMERKELAKGIADMILDPVSPPMLSADGKSPATELATLLRGGWEMGSPFPPTPSLTADTQSQHTSIFMLEDELRIISTDLAKAFKRELELEDVIAELEDKLAAVKEKEKEDRFSMVSQANGMITPLSTPTKRRVSRNSDLSALEQAVEQVAGGMDLDELKIALEEEREKCARLEETVRELKELLDQREEKRNSLKQDLEHTVMERDHFRRSIIPMLEEELERVQVEAWDLKKSNDAMEIGLRQARVEAAEAVIAKDKMAKEFNAIRNATPETLAAELKDLRDENFRLRHDNISLAASDERGERGDESFMTASEEAPEVQDRVKEVEEQRDALQQALRGLKERHQLEVQRSAEKIRALEMDREKFATLRAGPGAVHPSKVWTVDREMGRLREELVAAHRRADGAVKAKSEMEENLAKTASILEASRKQNELFQKQLDKHEQLRHNLSLDLDERYQQFMTAQADAEKATESLTMRCLAAERDAEASKHEAQTYKSKWQNLADQEKTRIEEEHEMAVQLSNAIKDVQKHLEVNHTLRQRLAESITRADKEQEQAKARYGALRKDLALVECELAKVKAETAIEMIRHEGELQQVKEGHKNNLLKVKSAMHITIPDVSASPLLTPLSPLLKSPRLSWSAASRGPLSAFPAGTSQVEVLEGRVKELEHALKEAETECLDVIERMQMAQIEIIELVGERDEARRKLRTLETKMRIGI